MVRENDYDAAAAGPIRVKVCGEWYEYAGEAPINVAIEWMSRQTSGAASLGEDAAQYMVNNYKTVLGADKFEEMSANKVGATTLDTLYRDLLDWWGLWKRPEKADSGLDIMLDRMNVLISKNVADIDAAGPMLALLGDIRETIADVVPEVAEDETVEDEAGNPA